jgi:branched-chain amino acid transport system permease protein
MNFKILIPSLIIIYLVVPFALSGNDYLMSMTISALVIAGVALAWALLGNLGGMVSFGHAAFFGVGAYVSALLTLKLQLAVFPSMFLGGIGAMVATILILPVLRLSGPYFALAILAYAHIFRILAAELKSVTNGPAGLSSIPQLPELFGFDFGSKLGGYLVIVTIIAIFTWIYHLIRKSHYGLALRAMHDSEDATRVVGVNSTLLKAMMLFVSAFMTGVIGAFNAHNINFLEPDYAFSGTWTIMPIIAAIFGGYKTLSGPLFGALAIYLLDQLVFKSFIPHGHEIMLGVLLGAMILFSPKGLVPLFSKKLLPKLGFKGKCHAEN